MRVLLNELSGLSGEVSSDEELTTLYAVPAENWLRVNFVSTLDGAATGSDGRSGSINNAGDKRIFDLLRTLADAVVVGAGTLRTEGYRPLDRPLVVVSRRGLVPEKLRTAENVLLVTWARAEGLAEARETLGDSNVIVSGKQDMDLVAMRDALAERGLHHLLSEGGPHLFASLLEAGLVDELDLTLAPMLVAGGGTRILAGAGLDQALTPKVLLEEQGSLIGRWFA